MRSWCCKILCCVIVIARWLCLLHWESVVFLERFLDSAVTVVSVGRVLLARVAIREKIPYNLEVQKLPIAFAPSHNFQNGGWQLCASLFLIWQLSVSLLPVMAIMRFPDSRLGLNARDIRIAFVELGIFLRAIKRTMWRIWHDVGKERLILVGFDLFC